MNKLFSRLLISFVCVIAAAPSALGTAYTWNQAAGGPWFFGSDWLPNTGPPTTGDTATFALCCSYNVVMSTTGDKADSVTVTGSAHPTLQSVTTVMPGVLTVTTGVATFNVQNSGDATIGSSTRPVNVTVGNFLSVDSGDLTIAAGSTFQAGDLSISATPSNEGTVTVTGAGSLLTTTFAPGVGDFGGGDGILFIQNGAAASLATGSSSSTHIGVVSTLGDNSTGLIEVQSGGSLTLGSLSIGTREGGRSGRLHISGAGSVVTQTAGGGLLIGTTQNNVIAADLTVENFGTFNSSTSTMSVENTGVINVGPNGTFNANGLLRVDDGGTVNILGGTYNGASVNATVSDGGTIHIRGGLMTLATLTISDVASQVNLDGGELQISAIAGPGRIDWHSGTFTLPNGAFSASTLPPIPLGGTLKTARLGSLTINGSMQQTFNSTIIAEGNTTMGLSSAVDGFASQGRLMVNGKTVTLLDANDVVFDSTSFVKLDDGAGTAGTLSAANGLTLNFGGNITGFGTVTTPNDPFKPLINNGHITGNSAAQKITLPGFVKGVGTLDNVTVTGTFAPGFSPATVYAGSVSYPGTLEIELAGTGSGQFDAIQHSGTATLGGTLNVSLNGFVPSAGNTFPIITAAGGISGTFASASLPALSGLMWQLNYQANTLSLIVAIAGDYNRNGTVDAADYVVWRKMQGQTGAGLAADGNGNKQIDQGDFDVWRAHFGQTAGSGSALPSADPLLAAVPEPSSAFFLVAIGVAAGIRRGSRIQRLVP